MSYRRSSYDPLAYVTGRPKRPFNWVQNLGLGFAGMALVWLLLHAAAANGLLGDRDIPVQPATAFAFIGMALVNSRREDAEFVGDAQYRRNRQWLLLTVGLLAVAAGIFFALGGGR